MKDIDEAIWVAKSLFDRNKVSGSTANLSFCKDGKIYITGTGTCFGNLSSNDFSIIEDNNIISQAKPSKELNLHRYIYQSDSTKKAVIHTHSTYITFWSCVYKNEKEFMINTPTPYLDMKVGKIGFVKYAEPGSEELFKEFYKESLKKYNAYVLQNHGVVVSAPSIKEAFYMLEEIEEASYNARLLSNYLNR